MDEMLQDANLDKFRVQFEKLHNALQDATQSNGRLQVKNREVNAAGALASFPQSIHPFGYESPFIIVLA